LALLYGWLSCTAATVTVVTPLYVMDSSPVVVSAKVCASIGPISRVVPFVTLIAGLVIATFGSYVLAAGMFSVTVIGEPPPFTTLRKFAEPHAIASPPPAAATGVITVPARVMT
jgi:hypothetical protein